MSSNSPDPADAAAQGAAAGLEGMDFETAIEELETLVDQMETGDLTLEASLAAYERGVKLARHCQSALRNAELKVKKLTEDSRLEPLDAEALGGDADDD